MKPLKPLTGRSDQIAQASTILFETPLVSFELRRSTGIDLTLHSRGKIRHYLTKILLATVTRINDRPVRWPISWWIRQEGYIRESMLSACAEINRRTIAF